MRAIWLIRSFFIILLLLAFGVEGYAGYMLLFLPQASVMQLLVLHVAASVMSAVAFSFYIPDTYVQSKTQSFILACCLVFFMPGFGLAGVILSTMPALFFPRQQQDIRWQDIPVPELPFKPVHIQARASYGEGGLASVMHSSRDPERRVQAVIAARQISDKVAVPLLQEALKDPVDDVRLFAYSVLDSKETHINDQITELVSDLKTGEQQDNARTHYALAQNYWELAFLGLATGNTLDYVLEQAEKHATLSAEQGWSGSDIEFLIGRIFLRQKKYTQAEQAFRSSLEHGALESAILPFLSEIAFERHDYVSVRKMLARLNSCCDGHPPIPAVVKAWGVD